MICLNLELVKLLRKPAYYIIVQRLLRIPHSYQTGGATRVPAADTNRVKISNNNKAYLIQANKAIEGIRISVDRNNKLAVIKEKLVSKEVIMIIGNNRECYSDISMTVEIDADSHTSYIFNVLLGIMNSKILLASKTC